MSAWTFFWCSLASPDFTVDGLSFESEVFKQFKDAGEVVDVKMPIYGTDYKCRVYACSRPDQTFKVAYGECSPGVYIAYADEATLPFCAPQFSWNSAEKRWVKIRG